MLKIVIIDDETNVRKLLKKILNLIDSDYKIVGEAASIAEAKKVIKESEPDIVLLDIELEDGTGFNLINQLHEINFKLIFITAYNQYAIKAFKFNALDFLLKPIDPDELKVALEKAKTTIVSDNELKQLIENLLRNQNTSDNKIVIKTTNKIYFVAVSDILFCKSEGSYAKIITSNQTIFASKNLKYFQDLLSEYDFIRTHQSFLVNKKYITEIHNDTIVLTNKLQIPISLRRKVEITNLLLNR
jgi:two-component system LytT family response regulator